MIVINLEKQEETGLVTQRNRYFKNKSELFCNIHDITVAYSKVVCKLCYTNVILTAYKFEKDS